MTDELRDQPDGQAPADVVDQAIQAIEQETVPAGPSADLAAATLGALARSGRPRAGSIPLISWASVFKLAATAASLAMVIAVAAVLIPIIESPSAALADVFSEALAQVRQPQSMSYRQQMTVEGQPRPIITQQYVAEDGRRRSEMAGYITIYDDKGNLRLTLVEPTHTAMVREAGAGQGPDAGKSFLDWLQRLKQLGDTPEKDLGKKEIDGKPASGFIAKQDDRTFTMWIDDASGAPLKIEFDSQFGGAPAHIAMSDFQFHQPLDEALFSFDVPPGYEVLGQSEDGKVESPAGLQRIWSRPGSYSGVASAGDRPLVYGLQLPGLLCELNERGEQAATLALGGDSRLLRAASLRKDETGQLLTFRRGGPIVEARSLETKGAEAPVLWSYPEEGQVVRGWSVNDVWPADLDGDALDEVIVGSGDFGVQVLDHEGKLLWKNTEQTKIWHVTAGDVEGNSRPEVLATGSSGKVQVFDAKGNLLREIDPGFYSYAVSFWQQQDPADRRLEQLIAERDALLRRIRNQKLQILLIKNRQPGGADAGLPTIEQTIDADVAKDPQIVEWTAERAELKALINEQRLLSRQGRRDLGQLKQQLAQLQQEYARREADQEGDSPASTPGKGLDLSAPTGRKAEMIARLERERVALQKTSEPVERGIAKAMDEYKKLDTETADLENRETQLADLKTIIKRISYQLNLWNLELDAEQRIKIVDPAQKPQGSDARQRALAAAAAGAVGFVTATLLAGLLLRRRWLLASGLGLILGSSLAALVMLFVPVHYEAQALIKVSKVLPVVIQNVQNGGVDEGASYDVYKKTQMQWVKSPLVLGRAARKSDMLRLPTMKEHKDDPVGYLESKITVDYPGDAELMRVSIKGTHRDDLATIVNSVVEAYMEEIITGDKMARLKQRDLLNEHYSKSKVEYRDLASSYHELAKQLGANSSETAQMRKKLLTMRLESLVASRNALEDQARELDFSIEVLKQSEGKADQKAAPAAEEQSAAGHSGDRPATSDALAAEPDVDESVDGALVSGPALPDLNRRISHLKLVIREQQAASPTPPPADNLALRKLLRQLADLEEKIEGRKSELQAAIVERAGGKADEKQPAAGTSDVDAMLPLVETELKELEQKLAAANEQIETQMQGGDRSKSLIVVAGSGEHDVPLAGLDVQGKTRWSLKLSAGVANVAARTDKPWLALSLRDGNVRVIDIATGKELAHVGRQGATADVAWLPPAEGKSLLVIAADSGLEAYRITADWQTAGK